MERKRQIQIPAQLELADSSMESGSCGVWSRAPIKSGTKFGPFVGEKTLKPRKGSKFVWEIIDLESKETLFFLDASNPKQANWMKFIQCARYLEEQNIVSEQVGVEIYYRAIRDIPCNEELLTWYEKVDIKPKPSKKRTAGKLCRKDSYYQPSGTRSSSRAENNDNKSATSSLRSKQMPSAAKSKRMKKQLQSIDKSPARLLPARESVSKATRKFTQFRSMSKKRKLKSQNQEKQRNLKETRSTTAKKKPSTVKQVAKTMTFDEMEKMSLIGKSAPSRSLLDENGRFVFSVKKNDLIRKNGRKEYQCDVCGGLYRHGFSLKRHYLRTHISFCYISKLDMQNCCISMENYTEEDPPVGIDQKAALLELSPAKSSSDTSAYSLNDSPTAGTSCQNGSSCKLEGARSSKSMVRSPSEESNLDRPVSEVSSDSGVGSSMKSDLSSSIELSDSSADVVTSGRESAASSKAVGTILTGCHASSCPRLGLFRCNICPMSYEKASDLCNHLKDQTAHGGQAKLVDNRLLLQASERGALAGVLNNFQCIKCNKCSMRLPTPAALNEHMKYHENSKELSCHTCGWEVNSLTQLVEHEKRHQSTCTRCRFCAATFAVRGEMKRHVQHAHADRCFFCAFCAKAFLKRAKLRVHCQLQHACSLEQNSVASHRAASHVRVRVPIVRDTHATSSFTCDRCRKLFLDFELWRCHQRTGHCSVTAPQHSAPTDTAPLPPAQGATLSGHVDAPRREIADSDKNSSENTSMDLSVAIQANLENFIEGKAQHLKSSTNFQNWRSIFKGRQFSTESLPIVLESLNFPPDFKEDAVTLRKKNLPSLPVTNILETSLFHQFIRDITNSASSSQLSGKLSSLQASRPVLFQHLKMSTAADAKCPVRIPKPRVCSDCHVLLLSDEAETAHALQCQKRMSSSTPANALSTIVNTLSSHLVKPISVPVLVQPKVESVTSQVGQCSRDSTLKFLNSLLNIPHPRKEKVINDSPPLKRCSSLLDDIYESDGPIDMTMKRLHKLEIDRAILGNPNPISQDLFVSSSNTGMQQCRSAAAGIGSTSPQSSIGSCEIAHSPISGRAEQQASSIPTNIENDVNNNYNSNNNDNDCNGSNYIDNNGVGDNSGPPCFGDGDNKTNCCDDENDRLSKESKTWQFHPPSALDLLRRTPGNDKLIENIFLMANQCKKSAFGMPAEHVPDNFPVVKPKIMCYCCKTCKAIFDDKSPAVEHHENAHKNTEVSILHIDADSILLRQHKIPDPEGILTICILPNRIIGEVVCSRCHHKFPSFPLLHEHMLSCGAHLASESDFFQVPRVKRRRTKLGWMPIKSEELRLNKSQIIEQEKLWEQAKLRKLSGSLFYNPGRHKRRRENVEVVDMHRCQACKRQFDTLQKLEKHAPSCKNKEQLLENGNDEDVSRLKKKKHVCRYCEKTFIHIGSLRKHVANACSTRKDRLSKGLSMLVDWENDVNEAAKVARQAWFRPESTKRKKNRRQRVIRKNLNAKSSDKNETNKRNAKNVEEIGDCVFPDSPLPDLPEGVIDVSRVYSHEFN